MGCGGSRADAIEPRYYESWTRETESTWLTYTDSDAPPSNAAPDSGPEAGGLHAGECARPRAAGAAGRQASPDPRSVRCGTAAAAAVVVGGGGGRQADRQTDGTCLVTDPPRPREGVGHPETLREAELVPEPRGNPAPPGPRRCPLIGRVGWGGRTARPALTPSPQPTHASSPRDAPPPGFGHCAPIRGSPSTGLLPLSPLMYRLTQITWVQSSSWLLPFLLSRVFENQSPSSGHNKCRPHHHQFCT